MNDEDTFFVSEEEQGERLDKILAQRFSAAGSRTYFQFLIDEGKVLLNGIPVKKRIKPKSGDEVEIEYVLTPELTLKAEDIPLNILYEDDALLVVNKPSGMVVHPAPGHWSGTFVNALLFHCKSDFPVFGAVSPAQDLRPGIVHRIDKETSGLLLAAKTGQAQQRLIEMFAGRQVYKEYLAICVGNPGVGSIDSPIGRHPSNRKMMAIVENGRQALTHYRTLAFDGKISLVNVIIATGRTHQIRVHMKHRGTPVLGDHLYGIASFNAKYGADRQMLHASKLRLAHPISGKPLEFEAEVPQDMQRLMKVFPPS
jgi:23S rRNA pseudouridine1911/1915/1917 synthase